MILMTSFLHNISLNNNHLAGQYNKNQTLSANSTVILDCVNCNPGTYSVGGQQVLYITTTIDIIK